MKIHEVRRLDEVSGFRSEWEEILSDRGDANVHYLYDWIYLLYKHMGDEERNRLYVIEDGNKVMGFIPLVLTTWKTGGVLPLRQLSFVGERDGVTDFCDFVIRRDAEEIIEYFFRYMRENKKAWHLFHLKYLTEDRSNLSEIRRALKRDSIEHEESIASRILYIDLESYGSWESYYQSLGRNLRKDLRKRWNRFRAYHDYRYERNGRLSSAELLKTIGRLYTGRQRQMGRESPFEDPVTLGFLREVVDVFRRRGILDFSLVYLEGKPVSFTLGFVYHNTYYHWSIGFDTEYSHLSPNKVHHGILIRDCFEEGISEFNFMRGDSEYKFKWTKTYRMSYQIRVPNGFSSYGRLVNGLRRIRRRRAPVRSSPPEAVFLPS